MKAISHPTLLVLSFTNTQISMHNSFHYDFPFFFSFSLLLRYANALLHAIHRLQRQQQRLRSQLSVSLRLHAQIQLIRQRQSGQREIHSTSFVQRDSHVLNEVIHEETRVEIALQHARSEVVDAPRASRASAHRCDHFFQIQSCFVSVNQTFTHADLCHKSNPQIKAQYHHRGDQNLVHHLRVLATATSAHVFDIRAHALEQRHHFLKGSLVSTNHDRQLAVTSANISSRHYRLHTGLLDYQEHPE